MRMVWCLFFLVTSLHASVLKVTTLEDSGKGSLRHALSKASSGDMIEFEGELQGILLLKSPLPPIQGDLIIKGPEKGEVTLDGNSSFSLLQLFKGSLSIANMNLKCGVNEKGGGVLFAARNTKLEYRRGHIIPSSTTDGMRCIFVGEDSFLSLNDITFEKTGDVEIAINGGTLQIINDIPIDYVVESVGKNGMICKSGKGEGEILLKPPNDLSLLVEEGSLVLTGEVGKECVIGGDAYVQGNFSVGSMVNIGTMLPGERKSLGAVDVEGDFLQVEDAILQLRIDPQGKSDAIQVGNRASLNGCLHIIPANGLYKAGTKFTLLLADNILGTFATISSGGLDLKYSYHPDRLEIEVIQPQEF